MSVSGTMEISSGDQSIALAQQRERYDQLCNALNVDEQTRTNAWKLFEKIYSPATTTLEKERFWLACSIYVASCRVATNDSSKSKDDSKSPPIQHGAGIPLSQLLRECRIRLVDFFQPLRLFLTSLALDAAYEQHVKLLERKYVIMSILYHKYASMFEELFHFVPTAGETTPERRISEGQQIFSFGWSLFVTAKGKLLSEPADLINGFHLLLCCLNLLLVHAPPAFRKVDLHAPPFDPKHSTLQNLCEQKKANFAEVSKMEERLFNPYLQTLCEQNLLKFNAAKVPSDIALVHNSKFYLGGLLESSYLRRNTEYINREYDLMHYTSGDFDERLFINDFDQIGSPSKLPPVARHFYQFSSPVPHQKHQSSPTRSASAAGGSSISASGGATNLVGGPATVAVSLPTSGSLSAMSGVPSSPPHRGSTGAARARTTSPAAPSRTVPQTPLAATLDSVNWLEAMLHGREAVPSAALKDFFAASADADHSASAVSESVQNRVKKLTELLSAAAASDWHGSGALLSRSRLDLIVKLYYKLLEAVLKSEQQRLKRDNFAALLATEQFHNALFAYAAEVICYSYKLPGLFPDTLTRLNVRAFEFLKLMEGITRQLGPEIPRSLVAYLDRIEEQILESKLWEDGSPLLVMLQKDLSLGKTLASQLRSNGTVSVSGLPATPVKGTMPLSLRSPMKTTSGSAAHPGLEMTVRKVAQLVSGRVTRLCEALEISSRVSAQISISLLHVIFEHSELLRNRHIDTLLLSCVYAVARINKLENFTFRRILERYRTQPQAHSRTYREVPLRGEEKGDIIKFYNQIFIPKAEKLLMQLEMPENTAPGVIASSSAAASSLGNAAGPATPPRSAKSGTGVSPKFGMRTRSAAAAAAAATSPTKTPSHMFHPPSSPVLKLQAGNATLTLSPLRNTPRVSRLAANTPLSLTPRTSALASHYNFGESPARSLETINSAVRGKTRKRLMYDGEEAPSSSQESAQQGGTNSSPDHSSSSSSSVSNNNNNNTNNSNKGGTSNGGTAAASSVVSAPRPPPAKRGRANNNNNNSARAISAPHALSDLVMAADTATKEANPE